MFDVVLLKKLKLVPATGRAQRSDMLLKLTEHSRLGVYKQCVRVCVFVRAQARARERLPAFVLAMK